IASRTILPPASNFAGSTLRPYLLKASVSSATLVGTASTLACRPMRIGASAVFACGACVAGLSVAEGAWQARMNKPALAPPASRFKKARLGGLVCQSMCVAPPTLVRSRRGVRTGRAVRRSVHQTFQHSTARIRGAHLIHGDTGADT